MDIFTEIFGDMTDAKSRVTTKLPDGRKVVTKLADGVIPADWSADGFAEASMHGAKFSGSGDVARGSKGGISGSVSGAAARSKLAALLTAEPSKVVPEKTAKRGRSVIPTPSTNGTHAEPAAV